MQRNLPSVIAASVLALVALVSMLTPWWTIESTGSGSVGGFMGASEISWDEDASARPFSGADVIGDGAATVSGLLVLLAVLGAVAFAVLRIVRPTLTTITTAIAGAVGLFLLLAVVLALTTWPSDGVSFWDDGSGSGGGVSTEFATYGNVGWYAAAVGVLIAGFLVVDGLRSLGAPSAATATPPAAPAKPEPRTKGSAASAPSAAAMAGASARTAGQNQCMGTTKSGSRCSRSATQGSYCATHA